MRIMDVDHAIELGMQRTVIVLRNNRIDRPNICLGQMDDHVAAMPGRMLVQHGIDFEVRRHGCG